VVVGLVMVTSVVGVTVAEVLVVDAGKLEDVVETVVDFEDEVVSTATDLDVLDIGPL